MLPLTFPPSTSVAYPVLTPVEYFAPFCPAVEQLSGFAPVSVALSEASTQLAPANFLPLVASQT
ncbi:MAG: hypothetical protein ACKO7W_11960, partial [Elainella sp.]